MVASSFLIHAAAFIPWEQSRSPSLGSNFDPRAASK
jgi:hypothetical protein